MQLAPAIFRYWRRTVPIFGHRLYIDHADRGTEYFRMRDLPAEQDVGDVGYITQHVRPGQTAIDLGANVGLLTLVLARNVGPHGRVIAFEPGPKAYALLRKNIRSNGYRRIVTAEKAAVCDRTGAIDLFVHPSGESDNRITGTLASEDDRTRHSIPCFALDDYLAGHNIGNVDFIKLDIQGAEAMAIRGAEQTLERNRGIQLVMEYAPAGIQLAGTRPADFLACLASMGFQFLNLTDQPEQHVTAQWLLNNIGVPGKPDMTNIALRLESVEAG